MVTQTQPSTPGLLSRFMATGFSHLISQALTWVDNDRAEGAVPHGLLAQNIRLSPRHHRCVPLVRSHLLRLQRLSPESHKSVHGCRLFPTTMASAAKRCFSLSTHCSSKFGALTYLSAVSRSAPSRLLEAEAHPRFPLKTSKGFHVVVSL